MFKTGNAFIDVYTKGIILLPLLPACIIFLRRIHRQTTLNYLMILCLLNFSEGLGLLLPGLSPENHSAVKNTFFLLEVLVFVQIIGSGPDIRLKNALNIFFITFLSVFITYFTLEGIDSRSMELDAAQHGIFLLLALPALVLMILDNSLYIFRLPLFWITTGTLFCFATIVLMEWVGHCCLELPNVMDAGKMALIDTAGLVKYLLYTLAALTYLPGIQKEESMP